MHTPKCPLPPLTTERRFPFHRPMSTPSAQPSVLWETGLWHPTPTWTKLPAVPVIESLARKHLFPHNSPDSVAVTATFFAENVFNRFYTITASPSSASASSSSSQYIFRTALSVEPSHKTASEVATLGYLRSHTSIPVPEVLAYDASSSNELGFEYMLTTKLSGVSLDDAWPCLTPASKTAITEQVTQYILQLRKYCRFDYIGSLYHAWEALGEDAAVKPTRDDKFVLGPLVTPHFYVGGRRLRGKRNRGPFENQQDYMRALTDSNMEDLRLVKEAAPNAPDYDEDLAEDAPEIEEALLELQQLLPKLFGSSSPAQKYVLHHHNLSLDKILVNPTGSIITGISNWENSCTVPSWQDTYPEFLEGPEMEEEPEPLAEGDTNDLRVEMRDNWEKKLLRKVFDGVASKPEEQTNDDLRRGFRDQLDIVGASARMVRRWITETKSQLDDMSN